MIISLLFFPCTQGFADEVTHDGNKPGPGSELDQLKMRVESIEKRMQEDESVDLLGNRLHVVSSLRGLKISGGLTMIAQLAACGERCQHEAFSASADLNLESPAGKDGRVVFAMDFQRGAGLQDMPNFFISPNGNPTGPNNDIESFNNDQLHVVQAYYEHNFNSKLIITLGQLTPILYFDTNDFANNERTQFIANLFTNNPTIEFGGSKDFYGPGVSTTYLPFEAMSITLGAFDGVGDYDEMCKRYLLMAEADFKIKHVGKQGNYRFYYWEKKGRKIPEDTANPNDAGLLRADSIGIGFSIDQRVSESFGIWLRGGNQSEGVAQFDRHISGGINMSGKILGSPNDEAGFGFGATYIGSDYENYRKSVSPDFESAVENYLGLYYNISIANSTKFSGLHISPDLQYVLNSGGDKNAPRLAIYGLRVQTFF